MSEEQKPSLADAAGATHEQVVDLYDNWAQAYDTDLAGWNYQAPQVAAQYLVSLCAPDVRVLDAGCGTGLVGAALRRAGFNHLLGIDASASSIRCAQRSGIYSSVSVQDLTALPVPLPDADFGALVCIGVMSYLPDVLGTCREFCRLVHTGGFIVMTQRTDVFEVRQTQEAFDTLASDGSWRIEQISEPRPYLPGHEEFADQILVRYGVFQRL